MPNGANSVHKQLRTELEDYIKSQYFGKSPLLLSALSNHIDDEGLLYQKPFIDVYKRQPVGGTDKPDARACRTAAGACLMSETFFHLLGPDVYKRQHLIWNRFNSGLSGH